MIDGAGFVDGVDYNYNPDKVQVLGHTAYDHDNGVMEKIIWIDVEDCPISGADGGADGGGDGEDTGGTEGGDTGPDGPALPG